MYSEATKAERVPPVDGLAGAADEARYGGAGHVGSGPGRPSGSPASAGRPARPARRGAGSAEGGLSQRLRDATTDVHEAAEGSTFMARLVDGVVPRSSYVALLRQYREIYRALEVHIEPVAHDPVVVELAAPALARRDAVESDLTVLAGPDWSSTTWVSNATATYVERLREIVNSGWAGGYVAHHYVRYLGDLSGGQLLARILQRSGGVPVEALAFYRFDAIEHPGRFKQWYRQVLDAVPWSDAEQAIVCDEARRAFLLNTAVFEELAAAELDPHGA